MKTIFKKSETNFGCYNEDKVKAAKLKATFTINDVLNANVPLKDKGWFIANRCELTLNEKREFAIGCALCVLPIYESKYPDNNAPRKAIEAAKAYLAGTISLDELNITRNAAYAAYAAYAADAAAYAADAADAAYAAYAAYAAAYAAYAADAADAAAYAAYAAYADKVNYKGLLLIFFKEFVSLERVVA